MWCIVIFVVTWGFRGFWFSGFPDVGFLLGGIALMGLALEVGCVSVFCGYLGFSWGF